MTQEQKVIELANTLKNQGLAASMMEAMEKARNIIGISVEKKEEKLDKSEIEKDDFDISKQSLTINELLGEAGVEGLESTSQEIENSSVEETSSEQIDSTKTNLNEELISGSSVFDSVEQQNSDIAEEVSAEEAEEIFISTPAKETPEDYKETDISELQNALLTDEEEISESEDAKELEEELDKDSDETHEQTSESSKEVNLDEVFDFDK